MNYRSQMDLLQQLFSRPVGITAVETFFYILVVCTALVGNTAVIWVVFQTPKLRTIPNMFVVSLAISDILLPLLCGPQSIGVVIRGMWPYTTASCQFQGFFVIMLACVSLQTMALVAANRYFCIVRNSNYKQLFTPKRTKIMVVLVWILACSEPAIYLMSGKSYVFHPGKMFCFQENKVSFQSLLVYVYVGLPLGIIIFCYFRVFQTIREHNKATEYLHSSSLSPTSPPNPNSVETNANVQSPKKDTTNGSIPNIIRSISIHSKPDKFTKKDIRVTKTLFLTIVGFLICWSPIMIIDFIDLGKGKASFPREVYVIYLLLGNISSTINPFIYGVMNPSFRTAYKRILRMDVETSVETT